MDAKNLYDGVGRLLTVSSSRELPKPIGNDEAKSTTQNGDLPLVENGVSSDEQTGDANSDEKEEKGPTSAGDEKPSNAQENSEIWFRRS